MPYQPINKKQYDALKAKGLTKEQIMIQETNIKRSIEDYDATGGRKSFLDELEDASPFPGKQIGKQLGSIANDYFNPLATREVVSKLPARPTGTQVFGDTLAAASTVAMPTAKTLLGNVVGGAGAGYAFDVGSNLAEKRDNAFAPGIGTLLGVAAPLAISGAGAVAKGLNPTMRSAAQTAKIESSIQKELDKVLSSRGTANALLRFRTKGTDVRNVLSRPNVFQGLEVVDKKIDPTAAIQEIETIIDGYQAVNKPIAQELDKLGFTIKKEDVRKSAIDSLRGKVTPASLSREVQRIDDELSGYPDVLTPTQVDDARAIFREVGRGNRGILQSDTVEGALENAFRKALFETADSVDNTMASPFAKLRNEIKNLINTTEFLNKNLRGQAVRGGRLGEGTARLLGAVAGSSGGPVGSVVGQEIGATISNILTDNQLSGAIKLSEIAKLTKDDTILDLAKAYLKGLEGLRAQRLLPAGDASIPRGGNVRNQSVVELPREPDSLSRTSFPMSSKNSVQIAESGVSEARNVAAASDSLNSLSNESMPTPISNIPNAISSTVPQATKSVKATNPIILKPEEISTVLDSLSSRPLTTADAKTIGSMVRNIEKVTDPQLKALLQKQLAKVINKLETDLGLPKELQIVPEGTKTAPQTAPRGTVQERLAQRKAAGAISKIDKSLKTIKVAKAKDLTKTLATEADAKSKADFVKMFTVEGKYHPDTTVTALTDKQSASVRDIAGLSELYTKRNAAQQQWLKEMQSIPAGLSEKEMTKALAKIKNPVAEIDKQIADKAGAFWRQTNIANQK